ncbi:ultraviolet-B receptor UVR8 isoform X2 [Cajanus cajan]|uniref:ultraviolet-B receptor UVR8 isoform X2 n=1 Tax=Cajanus cajan TaxID=3821 RepID=UPI00098DB193|nr:ultraviolet-B receptor UVR8 isoform X2 [Cajanus cajan]
MEDAGKSQKSGNPSRKVVDIAAGEAHTLLLAVDGSVYCWGKGMFGRLGTGSEKDELFPAKLNFGNPNPNGTEDTVKIVGIAAGAYHSLALAEDGAVWCWGYNYYGQLGINGEESQDNEYAVGDYSLVPHLLNKFHELHPSDSSSGVSEAEGTTSLKICAVKAGGMMSLAIDNRGTLWMWGNCPQQSKEGGLALVSSFTPTPVWDFQGHSVVKVACGNEHVVALVSAGESYNGEDLVCYSWGNNNHGQLGLGDRESRLHPEVVKTFDEESPYEVACGAFHTALLTHKKNASDTLESTCWTFGRGDNGQLGHGTTQSTLFPTPVKELPQNVSLICVDCGLFHTSVASSAGDVWSWGMEKGLGLCPDASRSGTDSGDALSPRVMSCKPYEPKFPDPVKVACGAAHTVIVAREGYRMWSWGRGRSGVLGDGKGVDCYTPTVVVWPTPMEDFEEEEVKSSGKEQDKAIEKETEATTETEEKLSLALSEMKLLQTKLSIMEKYASVLHGSIFGKPFDEQDIPDSLRNSGSFDIGKEWEKMLEAADHRKLIRLEMFYRDMLAGVKDELMKRRIKEIVKECLQSSEAKI